MDGSNFTPYIVAESSFGTTPATPTLDPLPFSGFTLAQTRDAIESANIKAGRFASKPVLGGVQCGGDINADLTDGDFDPLIEAVMGGTWSAGVLKAGTTRRSFTVAGLHSDSTDSAKYRVFRGMNVNTMNIAVSTDAIVTAVFGMIGKNEQFEDIDSTMAGNTLNSPSSTATTFDSFSGGLKIDGVSSSIVTEVNFTLDNQMERRATVFTGTDASEPSQGLSKLTGNLTAQFNNKALREKVLNATDIELEFTLTNANASYTFLFPVTTLTSGQPDVSGSTQVLLPMAFEATYDSVEATHLKITKV